MKYYSTLATARPDLTQIKLNHDGRLIKISIKIALGSSDNYLFFIGQTELTRFLLFALISAMALKINEKYLKYLAIFTHTRQKANGFSSKCKHFWNGKNFYRDTANSE